MAKNTYKKVEKKSSESKSLNAEFLKDRKFHLAVGWFLLLTAVFMAVSFVSYLKTGKADQSVVEAIGTNGIRASGAEIQNFFGISGAYVAHVFIFYWFGIAALLIPPIFFLLGVRIVWHKSLLPIPMSVAFTSFHLLWISTTLGYFQLGSDEPTEWSFLSGGIGYELALTLDTFMGWATLLLLLFLFLVFNMFLFNITHVPAIEKLTAQLNEKWPGIALFKKKEPQEETGKDDLATLIAQVKQEVEEEESQADQSDDELPKEWKVENRPPKRQELALDIDEDDQDEAEDSNELELDITLPAKEVDLRFDALDEDEEDDFDIPPSRDPQPISQVIDGMEVQKAEFVEKHADEQLVNYDPTLDLPNYKFPTADLLDDHPKKDIQVTKDELEQNKNKIVDTLINFKIGIQSIKATIGPTVTLYEIVPKAGVKISKIKNLEDDIALSLAALGIRIIAPIPGRGTIGIEVPNKNREMVDVKSVITTEKFMMSNAALPIVLGKTISNEVFVTDLSKMPHLLIAGATGQGKSVGLNMVLTSLLYKKHPSQLKFVLVDPKKVELTNYNKLERHFLAKLPDSEEAIITDTSKVVNTLNSLCIEMDSRYDLLKNAGCRNLKEYNQKFENRRLNPNKGHKYLPYIVLVIDELADLMMTAGKEVEAPIARLAQLARAIGIHLIVATQRPSVNVITGIIKANFPARLSFRVTSKVDSRTILDAGGADQLIGQGDMLLSLGSEMIRLQCAFVDTPEIDRVCDFISDQRGYDDAYLLPEYVGEEGGSGIGEIDLSERDALFADAARIIVLHQQGSTSLIQRKMKLGYNRAGRLIDQLEAAGIVGPFEGSKAREVLIPDEYSLEQLLKGLDDKY
jgi:S-DNA-T family DNA segregation ATPase FtsK/SpoIIIE